jgi:glycosyltransferase involved in cell wall biosynthesis
VLLVGNFLSGSVGTRGVCEDLAARLRAGRRVVATSAEPRRVRRLLDMVRTAWRRRNDYTVAQVDVYSGPAFIWAEIVAGVLRLLGKPYILTLHGGNLPAFASRWPRRVRRLLASARAVTTPSEYLREGLSALRPDMLLYPNPVDLSAYAFVPRRRLRPRLCWLRAFCEIYNPSLGVKVVAALSDDFPEVSLAMIGPNKGDGSLEGARRAAEELGVSGRVEWPGRIAKSEVSRWLNRGDIFLNTTNIDNTPVSVLEAMACGLCVVSTDVGGLPYLLEHERDALLVPPDDAEAMAAAVRRLLTEPGLAERLSANARKKVESFDWSAVLPRWERLLEEVGGQGKS